MAPSQLAQLKSALAGAGLNRQSKKGGSKQTGKAGLTNKDREKKQNKLNAIKETLNKFDVRETKVKNPVVGRVKDVKGLSGTPSQSRQRGLEMVSPRIPCLMQHDIETLKSIRLDRDGRLYSQNYNSEDQVILVPS